MQRRKLTMRRFRASSNSSTDDDDDDADAEKKVDAAKSETDEKKSDPRKSKKKYGSIVGTSTFQMVTFLLVRVLHCVGLESGSGFEKPLDPDILSRAGSKAHLE